MSIKVSVIVPVYNQKEDYLKDCLDSILNQTLKDIEVLCIDDGSTNDSKKIINEYIRKDNRIKLLHHEKGENRGLSASRNLGLKHAKGEFISFVDSDDYIISNFLKTLYDLAVTTGSDIAVSEIYGFYMSSQRKLVAYPKSKIKAETTKNKYLLAYLPKHNYVWNKLYKRDKLINCGVLFEEGRLYEDIDWSHKVIYYLGSMVATNATCYLYRQNKNSIVNNKSEKWLKDRAIAHRKTIDFLQSLPTDFGNMRNYDWTAMKTYKLFGITIMHIRTCGLYKLYYLFGKWLIFEIHEKRNIHD